jgi:glycosyltransferase involved in cell wall biosynthesis
MPEVAGDAALLTDPFNPASIAEAMLRIASDEKLRADLITKGINRRNIYTWQRTADLFWQSIEKAIK